MTTKKTDEGNWDTDCDQKHILLEGGPRDNHMTRDEQIANLKARLTVRGYMTEDAQEDAQALREALQELIARWRSEADRAKLLQGLDCANDLEAALTPPSETRQD